MPPRNLARSMNPPTDTETFAWIWSVAPVGFGILSGVASGAYFGGALVNRVKNVELALEEIKSVLREDIRDLRHEVSGLREVLQRGANHHYSRDD